MMTRGGRAVRLFLLPVVLAAACSSPTDRSDIPRGERERLEQNLALWRAQGYDSYRFEYRHRCFCPPAVTEPVNILVRGGAKVSVTYVTTGLAVPREHLDQYLTVEELFALARQALAEAASVNVSYDPALGYPTLLEIDWRREIADDEGSHQAASLQALR
jgi:hypothetical protein